VAGGAGWVPGPPPAGGAGWFVVAPGAGVVVVTSGAGDPLDGTEELTEADGLVDVVATGTAGFPCSPESFVNAAIAVPAPTTTMNAATTPMMRVALEPLPDDLRLAGR
jgi:hypothetical protein